MRSLITSIGIAGLLFAGAGQAVAAPPAPADGIAGGNFSVEMGDSASGVALIQSGSVQIPVAIFWKLVCTMSSCDFPGTPA
ncbi:hypothetical protein LTV02_00225 [Nocardia yamanashiensis]|uniref:hypothetical protein n=1 Tax=Nocardia yamanashiensis TaxID=209247 RepID=UPI001E3491E0|nr:hypothetical protein [Nocardia yamanashiensis]UGT41896.1 hypothetical protein LTV02_00225 [Nocardia yamanashiensis]